MQSGRLLYGAADMEVIERGLTAARLKAHLPPLGSTDLLVWSETMVPGDALFFDAAAPHGPEELVKQPMTYLSIIIYPRS